jgi:hypothetical protein
MGIPKALVAGLVSAYAGLIAPGQQPRQPARDDESTSESIALDSTATVLQFFKDTSDQIWPGFDLTTRPLLIYIPEKWVLFLNPPGPVEGFTEYPDSWPQLGCPALVHRGRYENLVGQLAFEFQIGGHRTVAIPLAEGLLPDGSRRPRLHWFSFIVHESFHQHQRETFASVEGEGQEQYPILDAENTALAVLEMRLLMDALNAVKSDDPARVRQLTAAFTAVRKHRWRRADPFVQSYESSKELVEGTAEYVEVRSVGLLAELCRSGEPSRQLTGICDELAPLTLHDYVLRDFEKRLPDKTLPPEDVARNRIYPVGSGLGLLLDYFGVEWKDRAVEDGRAFEFVELLEPQLDIDADQLGAALAWAEDRYDYEAILQATRGEIERYVRTYEAALSEFQKQPGYRIEVRVPTNGLSRSRSSRSKRWVADAGAKVLSKHFVVYTLKLVGTEEFFLQVRDSGVLDETDRDLDTKAVIFFAPELDGFELGGQPVDPRQDGTHLFEDLSLSGGNFEVRSKRPGTLIIDGRRLTVDLLR